MASCQKVIILGLGTSGEAAAKLLLAEGASVYVIDSADNVILRRRAAVLSKAGASVMLGQSAVPLEDFSVCIISPGIPLTSSWVITLQERGVPILSELELGWQRAQCPVLAVTGSNGKSTFAKLIAESLAEAGLKVAIAGNYEFNSEGKGNSTLDTFSSVVSGPVSLVIREHKNLDWLVLEVSSFQLETLREFRPNVGVLLNIYPNHLNRHGDYTTYKQLKAKFFSQMTHDDIAIVSEELLPDMILNTHLKSNWLTFGKSVKSTFRYHKDCISSSCNSCYISLAGTMFDNNFLGMAPAAAAAAMSACNAPFKALSKVIHSFHPLPHRIQELGTKGGIRFINDSKATNIAALIAALDGLTHPVHLIAGGLPKNESYMPVKPLLKEKVVRVYLIGEAAPCMANAWADTVPCHLSLNLKNAVQTAWQSAKLSEIILFSPGCASFDQFHNFQERGNQFISYVKVLKDKKHA